MRKEGDEETIPRDQWGEMPGPPYEWEEITTYQATKRRRLPRSKHPEGAPRACQFCGNPTDWIWWESSGDTWKFLCGRAGFVEICRQCHAWYPAIITILN
jgi:hypothetical protein